MTTCIALLRGINVGGNHMLPMKDLRQLVERAGCGGVRTYIQSGNVIFTTTDEPASLERRLSSSIAKTFGFEPRVIVLSARELARAAAVNPFPQAAEHPKLLHLYFLAEKPKRTDLKGAEALATATERFELKGKVFYLYTPDGFATSKLSGRVEQLLGVRATARNWRTVTTLLEMAAAE